MKVITTVDNYLGTIYSRTFLPLIVIMICGFLLRIYFTPWHLPPEAPDTIAYLIEGISLSRGDLQFFSPRFVWPAMLSMIFLFFNSDNYLDYVTIMRISAIIISVSSTAVLYFIAKQFVEKRFALIASALFVFEPNLVENSTFGITEPIFILIGLLSVYFILQEKIKLIPLSFLFAGLAFDTRFNGIVLFFLIIAAYFIRKDKKNSLKMLLIGIIVFVAISFPNYYNGSTVNQAFEFATQSQAGGQINPHIADISKTIFEQESPVNNNTPIDIYEIYKRSITKEILHLIWISLPYLILLVPFGLIISIKNFDFKKKVLLLAIGISLLIAIPQYTTSAVYRNLFFIIPFFAILATIAFDKFASNIDAANLFIVLFIAGLIITSAGFLRERTDFDSELLLEKEQFGKYVATHFNGNFTGDAFATVNRNLLDLSQSKLARSSNGNVTMSYSPYSIQTIDSLNEFIYNQNIDYIIIDNEYDSRYPIFQDIFYYEEKYPALDKVFDSDKADYKKYRVKIFKINYGELE